MDNRKKKKEAHDFFEQELIAFIILLLLIFILIVLWDKHSEKVDLGQPLTGEVSTYDGSLQRNITNPLGLE